MYKLTAVTKNYHKGRSTVAALRGVDLVIEDGEWLAVQGPTGHGKSTLLQILGGLDRPSSGIVEFDGRDLAQLRAAEVTKVRAQSIGFVFQTSSTWCPRCRLWRTWRPRWCRCASVRPRGGSGPPWRWRSSASATGSGTCPASCPAASSSASLSREPWSRSPRSCWPTSPPATWTRTPRDEIIGLLETMWRERGLTMVLITHDSSIARRAQRIGVMKNGRLGFKQSRPVQSRPGQAARVQAARTGGSVSTGTGIAPSPAAGLIPAGVQPAGVQPTGVQPTGVQPTGVQAGPARAADPADLESPRLQPPDLATLEDTNLDSDLDDADLDSDLEDDADLDSELPDFDDPDSEPADTITFG
jgi:putative ABC transport system ATP-binding protein